MGTEGFADMQRRGLTRAACLLGLAVVTACGTGATGTASGARTPATTPPPVTTSAPPLVVAVQVNTPRNRATQTAAPPSRVLLIGLDGSAVASAQFEAMPPAGYPNAVALLQPPVRAAAGGAFFVDRTGLIRRLARDGSVTAAGRIPLRSHGDPEVGFAVSPDGSQVAATVLTFPAWIPPAPGSNNPFGTLEAGGHWYLDFVTGPVGGQLTTVLSRDLGTADAQDAHQPSPTEVVGWDDNGIVATLGTRLATQQPTLSSHLWGTSLVNLAADGGHGSPIGGPDCIPVDELQNGTILCTNASSDALSVRTSTGTVLWSPAPHGSFNTGANLLSPDDSRLAAAGDVLWQTGGDTAIPKDAAGNQPLADGWVDADHLVIRTGGDWPYPQTGDPEQNLRLITVSDPSRVQDLGVVAKFVGMLT